MREAEREKKLSDGLGLGAREDDALNENES
jgi:hypothetical protein